jgi:phosphoribosylcarboxyaminoimidazole (NCAIR) mutase
MSLLRRKLQQAGISMSIRRIAERLKEIHEVVSIYPMPKGYPLRIQATLSQHDAEQEAMLAALQLASYIAK